MSIKLRLIVMNFLQFAVWGRTSPPCPASWDLPAGAHIGIFYSVQGIVSIFMPR